MNKVIADMLSKIGDVASKFEQEFHLPNKFRGPTQPKHWKFHRGYTKPTYNFAKSKAKRLQAKASRKINRGK